MNESDKAIPFTNMIYIGDGITDVPCMKITKEGGGTSIAVYTREKIATAKNLKNDERINYIAPSDYTKNSHIDIIVKKTIERIAINNELKDLEEVE